MAEALTNVAEYAQATHAVVRVALRGADLVVEVRDDGIGGASIGSGSGLSGLADRVGASDGTLSVDSPAGAGTCVRAVLPSTEPGSLETWPATIGWSTRAPTATCARRATPS